MLRYVTYSMCNPPPPPCQLLRASCDCHIVYVPMEHNWYLLLYLDVQAAKAEAEAARGEAQHQRRLTEAAAEQLQELRQLVQGLTEQLNRPTQHSMRSESRAEDSHTCEDSVAEDYMCGDEDSLQDGGPKQQEPEQAAHAGHGVRHASSMALGALADGAEHRWRRLAVSEGQVTSAPVITFQAHEVVVRGAAVTDLGAVAVPQRAVEGHGGGVAHWAVAPQGIATVATAATAGSLTAADVAGNDVWVQQQQQQLQQQQQQQPVSRDEDGSACSTEVSEGSLWRTPRGTADSVGGGAHTPGSAWFTPSHTPARTTAQTSGGGGGDGFVTAAGSEGGGYSHEGGGYSQSGGAGLSGGGGDQASVTAAVTTVTSVTPSTTPSRRVSSGLVSSAAVSSAKRMQVRPQGR